MKLSVKKSLFRRAATMLFFCMLTTVTAWADNDSQIYSGFSATAGTEGFYNVDWGTDERYGKLVDGDLTTKWCGEMPNEGNAYIEFRSEPFVPTSYILTTASDNTSYPWRNPKNWTIKAKLNVYDDNEEWTTLVTVENDGVLPSLDNNKSHEYTINNNTNSYQYFRFEFSSIHDEYQGYNNDNVFQLSELQFKSNSNGSGNDHIEPQESQLYSGFTSTAGTNGFYDEYNETDERCSKLVDGNLSTKWCGEMPYDGAYIEFQSSEPFVPTSYILTTASDNTDYPWRNPKNWTIKAKLNVYDDNEEWTTLVTVENDDVLPSLGNKKSHEYTITGNTNSYQYFRFEFSSIHDEYQGYNNDNVFQLSELQFKSNSNGSGNDPIDPQAPQLYSGFTSPAGTNGFYDESNETDERCDKLVDGNLSTKWCGEMPYDGAYIEFRSEPFVPTSYILTTASDNTSYPWRNPKNWTIKAKLNVYDDNEEWTTLDTVEKDEVLPSLGNNASHEYTITGNTNSYQYFRFEFSSVQDGNVFQLSEL